MSNFTEGADFYYNAEGLVVLTSAYHLKRGKCCGTGCLHCPYDYENGPERKRKMRKQGRPVVIFGVAAGFGKKGGNGLCFK